MHLLIPAVALFIVLSIVLYLLFGNKSGTSQQESVSQRDPWRPGTVAYEDRQAAEQAAQDAADRAAEPAQSKW
jgi:hypothetical protein